MTAHTPDHLARTYVNELNRRRLDRLRRGVQVCACGAEYAPTSDGRRQHRTLHGHTPAPSTTPGGDVA